MFCSTATRCGRNKTSWSGQSPDTPEQGRIHPRTRITRHAQAHFYDTGQAWHGLGLKTPRKRDQAVLRRGVIIDAGRRKNSGTDFKYIIDGEGIFKICFAALLIR